MTKYRTVDVTTLKGLKLAERLHRNGWQMGRVGPFTIQFYKREVKRGYKKVRPSG